MNGNITPEKLRRLADKLEAAQAKVLASFTGGKAISKATKVAKRKGMSPATKAKLRKLAKARWAAARKEGKATL